MKRDIVFVVNEGRPKFDVDRGEWEHGVEVHLRFSGGTDRASMTATIVRVEYDAECCQNAVRRDMCQEHMQLEGQDAMLAASCAFADDKTATDIAHSLFWHHVVLPSMEGSAEPHWLRKHMPAWWEHVAKAYLAEKERCCSEVQES